MRWRWPPENSCGKRSVADGSSPTSANNSLASAIAFIREVPCPIGPWGTRSPALRRGFSAANEELRRHLQACTRSRQRRRASPAAAASLKFNLRIQNWFLIENVRFGISLGAPAEQIEQQRLSTFDAEQQKLDLQLDRSLNICTRTF